MFMHITFNRIIKTLPSIFKIKFHWCIELKICNSPNFSSDVTRTFFKTKTFFSQDQAKDYFFETKTKTFLQRPRLFQDQDAHFSCKIKCFNVTCHMMHTCNAHMHYWTCINSNKLIKVSKGTSVDQQLSTCSYILKIRLCTVNILSCILQAQDHSTTDTIWYNILFALKNWQASCQFNLAHELKEN